MGKSELEILLAAITPDNIQEIVDFGADVGLENQV
jgi:hypothetical protein